MILLTIGSFLGFPPPELAQVRAQLETAERDLGKAQKVRKRKDRRTESVALCGLQPSYALPGAAACCYCSLVWFTAAISVSGCCCLLLPADKESERERERDLEKTSNRKS